MDDRAMDLKGINRTSLIDVTSEDDHLVSDPSHRENHNVGRPEVGTEGTEVECPNKCCVDNEEVPVPHRPKKGASDKFNLRKSLAWDSAFFTSEGVLNSEELAIVNSTFRKVESHALPAIQEDMRKSYESSTTVDDECLTVESIEVELFGNLRASIQKSYDKCDTISTIEQPGKTTGSRKVEFQESSFFGSGSKKTEIPSHVGKKPPMVLKRDGVHKLRQNETSKELSSSQDAASGKGNPIKQQRMVPSVVTGPAKKSSIPQLIQVKKNTQSDSDSNHPGRTPIFAREVPATLTRKTTHGSSSSTIPPGGSLAVSGTSYMMRPGRMLDQTRKDPMNPPRKKVDSQNSAKITSNGGLRSHLVSERKNVTANAKIRNAFLKFSTASPSSSLESTESSCSSVSTATTTTDINSSSNFGSDNTAYQPIGEKFVRCRSSDETNASSADPSSLYHNPTSGVNSRKISRTSGQPASVNCSSETKLSKPSGLRMPRPKIGYFDAKSMTRNLSTSQVESQCATPRITSRLEGSSGTLKLELSGTVLESIKTRSRLESVLQSATSSTMASPATAMVSPSTKVLDDQNNMKNVRGENSHIREGIVSGTNKSTNPACQVGSEISNGDNPHTNSDTKCMQQYHPTGVLVKAGELKMHDINNSVEENLKDKRISWKASVNSEKPSSILSSNATKTMPSHLADNTGKENLLPLESQMD